MTLSSMAGIQLTGDDYKDQSPAMSGAMQPPTATVEEIDVAVFIDEYLQQLNPTASTAPPTNHNTNNFSNNLQFNANGEKEDGQQQHQANIDDDNTVSDNASFETLEFDIDMIGHENILVKDSEGQLQPQEQESDYSGLAAFFPSSNSNNIISNNNNPIEAQFHIVPFNSEPCLSQASLSQFDLCDELRTEEAIDISSFNNENIPLTCNNDPLLSSAWQSPLEPYNGKLDLEDTNDMYTLSEEPYILYEGEGESNCGESIDSTHNSTQLQSMEVDTAEQEEDVVVHEITVQCTESKPQSQNFLNDLIYYQPDTPQSPPSCMSPSPSPSPSATSISPKSRSINRPARRASATKKALLNLNIPFNAPTIQQAVQTPDILEALLAEPKLQPNEPRQSIQDLIAYLQVPEASDANTTRHNSSSSNSSRFSREYILGEYIPNQSDSNVSSPKSFAESYDDQPYTPQSHTSNTTYTTAADYQPYSPALSVSSCTQSVTNITTKTRKRGRPAKEHSDQPDENELAKLPEVEQKRLLNRAKNNEASRLSRERAKRKESEVADKEMRLTEENKQLLERYAELEHLEAKYKRMLMSH